MKIIKFLLTIFILLILPVKANSNELLIEAMKEGGKLIFIRHAYAPGSGDPENFSIKNCLTQRNLNQKGRDQSAMIGVSFKRYNIPIENIISSEWCRCKDTTTIAFGNKYEVKSFLNSFYDERFFKNKEKQIIELKKYISNWNGKKNLIFVTHFVVISEILKVYPSSGEIVISNKNYKVIGSLNSNF
jgi:phosphohistidine phosphatase SixA